MESDLLEKLENWYRNQCDGDWEHEFGVQIDTLDNPGWKVSIDLIGSGFEEKSYSKKFIERGNDNWISCWVENNRFEGRGGIYNLREILNCFFDWVADD